MEPRNYTDEGLMREVAQGESEALNALLRRYATPLLTFIQRIVGNRHRAEDLFQEVFLAVWVGRDRYRYPYPFRPWLFGVAANKCKADLRRRDWQSTSLDDCPAATPPANDPPPPDAAVATERAALVAEAIGRMPPAQRMVVTMRVWNGLSYSEIAEAVGRSEATVRSHMFHGLATLRRYLEPRMK
jgi:RNA polymerase sigma-70 factor (ECF subfamily)